MSKRTETPKAAAVSPIYPTEEMMLAEAAGMGDDYGRVTTPTVDLLAENREMQLARGDVRDLIAREYDITDEMFERLIVLAILLGPNGVRAAVPEERSDSTEAAEASRDELMTSREDLSRIGEAGGLDSRLFVVDSRRYDTLVDSMATVVKNVKHNRAKMPDKVRVDALLARAQTLIDAELASRLEGSIVAAKRADNTKLINQLKRLMVDQLRHISKQGLAAYPGDAVRAVAYRLDRLTPPAKKSVAPTEPTELESDDDAVS